jgi:hypothetical protein
MPFLISRTRREDHLHRAIKVISSYLPSKVTTDTMHFYPVRSIGALSLTVAAAAYGIEEITADV